MNSRNNNDDSWIILVIGGVVAIAAYVIWQFSTFFNLDISSGASVFGRLIGWVVLAGASWKFGDDIEQIRPGAIWPILLASFWACWWPALAHWASQVFPFSSEVEAIWWNAWYFKWGVFVAILGLGYLIKKIIDDGR
jgi:hypothetical protein